MNFFLIPEIMFWIPVWMYFWLWHYMLHASFTISLSVFQCKTYILVSVNSFWLTGNWIAIYSKVRKVLGFAYLNDVTELLLVSFYKNILILFFSLQKHSAFRSFAKLKQSHLKLLRTFSYYWTVFYFPFIITKQLQKIRFFSPEF